jgi:hypothetical protein
MDESSREIYGQYREFIETCKKRGAVDTQHWTSQQSTDP